MTTRASREKYVARQTRRSEEALARKRESHKNPKPKGSGEKTPRPCLRCLKVFLSAVPKQYNRICVDCAYQNALQSKQAGSAAVLKTGGGKGLHE